MDRRLKTIFRLRYLTLSRVKQIHRKAEKNYLALIALPHTKNSLKKLSSFNQIASYFSTLELGTVNPENIEQHKET